MKKIPLSQSGFGRPRKNQDELFALVDDDDYEWLNQWNWTAIRTERKSGGYAMRNEHGESIMMHRLIMDAPPDQRIDHRDGNGLNNQRDNLRFATPQQNIANKRVHKNNKSGYKGVHYNKQAHKWMMAFTVNTDTAEEAARLYDRIARFVHGEFAATNFED